MAIEVRIAHSTGREGARTRAGLTDHQLVDLLRLAPPSSSAGRIRRDRFSMCQCGAWAARHDGGVTRLKNAASWESTIRSAYPSRQQRQDGRDPCARRAARAPCRSGPSRWWRPRPSAPAGSRGPRSRRSARSRAGPAATPRSVRNASWSRPLRDGAWVWVVIGTPVRRCAAAAASITRRTSGVRPWRSVTTLSIPARTPVPAMPDLDVAQRTAPPTGPGRPRADRGRGCGSTPAATSAV